MNRATRDKFVSGTDQSDLTTGNACWETPPAIFAKLNADFGAFDVDLTADARRALCPIWFGPQSPWAVDALVASWIQYGRSGYSNPPYGPFIQRLLPWAKAQASRGFASTFLLPMRATKAFRLHILHGAAELLFCDKRITFWEYGAPRLNPRTGKPDGALFDSIVVRYLPEHIRSPRVGVWVVPPHLAAVGSKEAALAHEREQRKTEAV